MTGRPQLDLTPSRGQRITTMVVVALLHLLVFAGLIRAFAPDLSAVVVDQVISTFSVTVATTEPEPPPQASTEPEGASAEEGRKAKPKEVSAPRRTLPKKPEPAPPVSSTGNENASGAADAGAGTGGGGDGIGTGSGRSGTGQGGGAAARLEKIAGDISSAKDYPKKTRNLRIGQSVTILLTVDPDGRVRDCRVTQPSPDAEADAITCRLASERFRFRPARNAAGEAVTGKYAWRQRWFY